MQQHSIKAVRADFEQESQPPLQALFNGEDYVSSDPYNHEITELVDLYNLLWHTWLASAQRYLRPHDEHRTLAH